MAAPTKTSLLKRWNRDKILAVEVLLDDPKLDLDALGRLIGFSDGQEGVRLVDLRAFPFRKRYDSRELHGVDMSHCQWDLKGKYTRVVATNCRFQRMRITGALAARFVRCDFSHSALIENDGTPGVLFERCDFSFCRFRKGDFLRCEFRDCTFASARIPDAEFLECVFSDCEFTDAVFDSGSFGQSTFRNVKNNFLYKNLEDMSPAEFVADPRYPTVNLAETSMIGVKFAL